ncbi:condensation domain-containing protein, partial [Rubrivivax gelatinosus]
EPLIGFFVNTLALRVPVHGEQTLAQLLQHVKDVALQAYEHADVPFEQVVEAVQPQRSMAHSPVFQVTLALDEATHRQLSLPGLSTQVLHIERGGTPFDLSLSLGESEGQLVGALEYASDLYERDSAQR